MQRHAHNTQKSFKNTKLETRIYKQKALGGLYYRDILLRFQRCLFPVIYRRHYLTAEGLVFCLLQSSQSLFQNGTWIVFYVYNNWG